MSVAHGPKAGRAHTNTYVETSHLAGRALQRIRANPKRVATCMVLCIYATSYLTLSCLGEYRLSNHGGADWRVVWCPPCLTVQKGPWNALRSRARVFVTDLGVIYYPLILLDRACWHPNRDPDSDWT